LELSFTPFSNYQLSFCLPNGQKCDVLPLTMAILSVWAGNQAIVFVRREYTKNGQQCRWSFCYKVDEQVTDLIPSHSEGFSISRAEDSVFQISVARMLAPIHEKSTIAGFNICDSHFTRSACWIS
jgi:hypothetical protein